MCAAPFLTSKRKNILSEKGRKMTQKGKVVKVIDDKAVVSVIRTSACEGCKQKNLCIGTSDSCSGGKAIEAVAKNTASASVGDEVVLESSSAKVLFMTFAIFVLPIIIAFCAYVFAGKYFTQNVSYIVSACAFVFPLVILCYLLNRSVKKDPGIEIVKIIKKEI